LSLLSLLRRRRRPLAEDGRRGFTMVEVLTVMAVMGTLVRMAVPSFHDVLVRARAAEVIGDFEVVRVAVLSYHADHSQWPADGHTGQVPPGLAEYLPDNFSFEGMGYRLDWENWVLPGGLPQDPEARGILAVSVVTQDRELGYALGDILGGGMAHYALGDAYTFVIERR
jgi:prepilin-type N-terminal cleavage/methylation domain-containing protein